MTDYPSAKLRELLRSGDLEDVDAHAGLLQDPDLERVASFCQANLSDVWADSVLAGDVVRAAATAEARKASMTGNQSMLGLLTGIREGAIDSSAVQALVQTLERVDRDGYLATFFGRTDGGKTNMALLMAEVALSVLDDVVLVTNITSVKGSVPDDRLHVVEDFPTFQKTVETLREHGLRAFVILDEMSSHASGYSGDRQETEEHMRKFVRAAAKLGCMVVAIGHDGGDVHPTVRDFSDDIITLERLEPSGIKPLEQMTEYTATFWEGVEERNPYGERFAFERVPKTSLDYNPNERTDWEWSEPATV